MSKSHDMGKRILAQQTIAHRLWLLAKETGVNWTLIRNTPNGPEVTDVLDVNESGWVKVADDYQPLFGYHMFTAKVKSADGSYNWCLNHEDSIYRMANTLLHAVIQQQAEEGYKKLIDVLPYYSIRYVKHPVEYITGPLSILLVEPYERDKGYVLKEDGSYRWWYISPRALEYWM